MKPECLEIDDSLRNMLINRGFKCYDKPGSITKTYSGIYTSNVLEHIENDDVFHIGETLFDVGPEVLK